MACIARVFIEAVSCVIFYTIRHVRPTLQKRKYTEGTPGSKPMKFLPPLLRMHVALRKFIMQIPRLQLRFATNTNVELAVSQLFSSKI